MIVNKFLNHIFTSPSIVAILRELDRRVAGITGREISRLANISHRTALKALDNLEALKLVSRKVAGRSYYFTINRNQFIYKNIISAMFENERKYKQKLFNQIKKIKNDKVVSLIIFGSVARKEETYDSDLDLCIVYIGSKREIEKKVNEVSDSLYKEYGVTLAPFYILKNNFRKKAINLEPPINNILKEGVVIYGETLTRIKHG